MRATLIHGPGDVRVADVPDPTILQPTDAQVRITTACVCGQGEAARVPLADDIAGGYRAMAGRVALKVLVRP